MLKRKIILILNVPRLNVSVKITILRIYLKSSDTGYVVSRAAGCSSRVPDPQPQNPSPSHHPLIPAALWPASLFLCASRECFFKPWQTRCIRGLYPICGHNYLSYATSHWDVLVEVKPVFPLGFWKTHMERVHRNRKAHGPSQQNSPSGEARAVCTAREALSVESQATSSCWGWIKRFLYSFMKVS